MLWVGEYSASQDAFHIQLLADAKADYLKRARVKDSSNDWFPVAIGEEEAVRQELEMLGRAPARLLPVIPCNHGYGYNLIFLIPCPYCGRKHIHGSGRLSSPPLPWSAGHRWSACLAKTTTRGGSDCKIPPGSEKGYILQVVEAKRNKGPRPLIIGG